MTVSRWTVEFEPSARKEFRQLSDKVKTEAEEAIRELADDPFPNGFVELRGHQTVYRIRCCRNSYRIIYRVSQKKHKVIVSRIRSRGSAYQGL